MSLVGSKRCQTLLVQTWHWLHTSDNDLVWSGGSGVLLSPGSSFGHFWEALGLIDHSVRNSHKTFNRWSGWDTGQLEARQRARKLWALSRCRRQPGRRSSTDPSRFEQDAGTAKEPAISARSGVNTCVQTHMCSLVTKWQGTWSLRVNKWDSADAEGGWSQRCRCKDRQGAPLRRQEADLLLHQTLTVSMFESKKCSLLIWTCSVWIGESSCAVYA